MRRDDRRDGGRGASFLGGLGETISDAREEDEIDSRKPVEPALSEHRGEEALAGPAPPSPR